MDAAERDDVRLRFLRDGYVWITPTLPQEFHSEVCERLERIAADEGKLPGDDLMTAIPLVAALLEDPAVAATVAAIHGSYLVHPHRAVHANGIGLVRDPWHKETHGGAGYKLRNHRPWWTALLYYPQATTRAMGPTEILPSTHVLEEFPFSRPSVPLTTTGGGCALVHYDIWHRRSQCRDARRRWLVKLELTGLRRPGAGASGAWPAQRGPSETEPDRETAGRAGSEPLVASAALPEVIRRAHAQWYGLTCSADASRAWEPCFDADDWRVRLRTVAAVSTANLDAGRLPVVELANAVHDEHELVAVTAAYALAAIGEAGAPEAGRLLEHPATSSARRAAHALSMMGDVAVPFLTRSLASEQEQARYLAAFAAGEHESLDGPLVAALRALVRDPSPRVRVAAVEALGLKADDRTLDALRAATLDTVPDVRQHAALALARLGMSAATPDLRALCADTQGYVGGMAAEALRALKTHP